MSYIHIENLYKDRRIMLLKQCYALEQVHGTSAHLAYTEGEENILYFAGGANRLDFTDLFDGEQLLAKFKALGLPPNVKIIVYGEAYGGKLQGMAGTYGDELDFIVFEVKIRDTWLNVPKAEKLSLSLGLPFVSYNVIMTTMNDINDELALPSYVGKLHGIKDKPREGIVLRPLEELYDNRGNRLIVKHKNTQFMETKSPREVSPDQPKTLEDAEEIASEWVTWTRLRNAIGKLTCPVDITATSKVIDAMQEDILREANGEIIESRQVCRAIGRETVLLYKAYLEGIKAQEADNV